MRLFCCSKVFKSLFSVSVNCELFCKLRSFPAVRAFASWDPGIFKFYGEFCKLISICYSSTCLRLVWVYYLPVLVLSYFGSTFLLSYVLVVSRSWLYGKTWLFKLIWWYASLLYSDMLTPVSLSTKMSSLVPPLKLLSVAAVVLCVVFVILKLSWFNESSLLLLISVSTLICLSWIYVL